MRDWDLEALQRENPDLTIEVQGDSASAPALIQLRQEHDKAAREKLEKTMTLRLMDLDIPEPVREHKFATDRRWRFDFAWPDLRLALEVEGGTWVNGRHNRASSIAKDMEKYNQAGLLGWTVLRYTGDMIDAGLADADLIAFFSRSANVEG